MNGSATESLASAPAPSVRSRILTDLCVTQIPWWAEKLTVLPPAGSGSRASLDAAWRTVRSAARYDVFISANVRNALALGLFKRLTGRRRPLIMMTEMRLDDPMPGARWRLKIALQRFAYAAVDAMCVSARREAEVYSKRLRVPLGRFRFIPWHTNVLEPRMSPPVADYLFAAGRTGRDWRTLAVALQGISAPVTVVCSRPEAANIPFPENVTVLTDIPYHRYRELLEGAKVVLVPLEPHTYSSGQVVILEAMALGKPVITTRVLGTEDYIDDGLDGMLVSPGNPAELRDAIVRMLSTWGLAERLGRAALDKVLRSYTLDRYVHNIVGVAEELAANPRLK